MTAYQQPIPTGSLQLDLALGGGIPRGEFIEISGPENSGKTTLCLHIVAAAQRLGGDCSWIDADYTFSPAYATICGIDPQRLYISQPTSAEQAYDITMSLVKSSAISVVVIDPVYALVTQGELEASLGQGLPGSSDSQLSGFLRRMVQIIRQNGATLIFTTRPAPGISAAYHGLVSNPSRLALPLRAGLRLILQPVGIIQRGQQNHGLRVRVRIVKRKNSPCFQNAEFDIIYNNGIRKASELFELGVQLQLIHRQRDVYIFRGQKLGKRREDAIQFLDQEEQKTLVAEIEQAIRWKMLPNLSPAAT